MSGAVPKVASAVYFAEDICQRLQIARSTLERLRRAGVFPIPELPSLDRRPRWLIADVEAFLSTRQAVRAGKSWARRHGSTVKPLTLARKGNTVPGNAITRAK